jgi:hypothetical protein
MFTARFELIFSNTIRVTFSVMTQCLLSCLSPRKPGFDPGPFVVRFMMDILARSKPVNLQKVTIFWKAGTFFWGGGGHFHLKNSLKGL